MHTLQSRRQHIDKLSTGEKNNNKPHFILPHQEKMSASVIELWNYAHKFTKFSTSK